MAGKRPVADRKERSINHRFDRTEKRPERAVLVGFASSPDEPDSLEELERLATTAGAGTVASLHQRRASVNPGSFLSRGKIEEARELIDRHEADLVICDEDLSPAQVRNLEESLKVKVLDRTELILDIFALRARSRESKLQVELAQLRYLLPRLAGMWAHFSRTGGGIGTRGPGETQLEVDRRRVREKIAHLETNLVGVDRAREVQLRLRRDEYRISLVGYTNAGKSTLFNQLTRSSVLAEDRLFATLDTTTRRVVLPGDLPVLVSDTVGFIRKLPHHLVASFRATLREVRDADLLLHVVDASHPGRRQQMAAVDEVLEELLPRAVPRLIVLNKADLVTEETAQMELALAHPDAVLVSALRREDLERLRESIATAVRENRVLARIECSVDRLPQLRAFTRRAQRLAQDFHDGTVWTHVWLEVSDMARLRRAGFRVEMSSRMEPSGSNSESRMLAEGLQLPKVKDEVRGHRSFDRP